MLILASTSETRRNILHKAGVVFKAMASPLNEDAIKQQNRKLPAHELAGRLALAKAQALAAQYPGDTIIGADQTLECEGELFGKPKDATDAARQLMLLRAKTHRLHSAFSVIRGDNILAQHLSSATLHMRAFSESFLQTYIRENTPGILTSVGCYRIEESGIQLFESIDGDHTTILGLPLLPLLAFLRKIGEVKS